MKKTLAILLAMTTISACLASGFQLYSESAADALGRAGTGIGGPGSASSAWYNNAATTDIKRVTASAGIGIIKLSSTFHNDAGPSDDMEDDPRYCGFFYGIVPLNDTSVFSLSVNAPYGMITSWKSGAALSTTATFTSIRVCYISPGFAVKATETISLGAGFNVAIGTAHMARRLPFPANNKMDLTAAGYGVGYFLSALWRPLDDWSFGMHYQSRVRIELKGEASYRYGIPGVFEKDKIKATLDLPATFGLGVTNSSFKKWRFLADAIWTEWESYETLAIYFRNFPGTGTSMRTPSPGKDKHWHNVWSYHVGAEYLLNDNWTLRCGAYYDFSPANDRYRANEMPESDKMGVTFGIGYRDEHWGADIGYMYAFWRKARMGTVLVENGATDGYFTTDVHVLGLQLTYAF